MKPKVILFLIPIASFLLSCSKRQESDIALNSSKKEDFYEKCRKLVLSENKIAKTYNFKIKGNEIDEIGIQYLGNIITSNKDTLKVINSVNYTGLYHDSRKANANFFLYKNNKRIGFYHLSHLLALPSQVSNNNLIFDYKNDECNQFTSVSLKDSIPKTIFIKCKDNTGDLYTFEQ